MSRSGPSPTAGLLLAEGELEGLRGRWSEPHSGGGSRRGAMLEELERRRGGAGGPPLDLRGLNLVEADLSGADLAHSDLSGADLSRANLAGAVLFGAKLVGTTLFRADLTEAELSGADLTGANLENACAERAGFGMARLDGASLVEASLQGATLTGASLQRANLAIAKLKDARARGADFTRADLTRADLRHADLEGSDVDRATFADADLRAASLARIRGYQGARWLAADVRGVDFNHAYMCRRFIMDQNFLEEFRTQSRLSAVVYGIWWLTSDCGRSLLRWSFFVLTTALVFAGVYAQVDVDYGSTPTPIAPFYFSVVTLTTLGYGDVTPASEAAQIVAMAEVFMGYMMLGGLLSIFSNKMARRAE